jgi:hypothetical protein
MNRLCLVTCGEAKIEFPGPKRKVASGTTPDKVSLIGERIVGLRTLPIGDTERKQSRRGVAEINGRLEVVGTTAADSSNKKLKATMAEPMERASAASGKRVWGDMFIALVFLVKAPTSTLVWRGVRQVAFISSFYTNINTSRVFLIDT